MFNLTDSDGIPVPAKCRHVSDVSVANQSCRPLLLGDSDKIAAPLVSDETRFYFEIVVLVAVNAMVSLFGTVANIVNIIVYAKMGLGDVVNISLLGLAVSDLLSVVMVVWICICHTLFMIDPPGIVFDPMPFYYVTGGWPHFISSRVTCYITAMVSIERCLCVVAPFKVKEIITPGRIKVCLVVIFTVFPAAYIPVLMVHRLAWKFDATHNETRITADFAEDRDTVQTLSYYINDLFLPTLSIVVVTACSIVTATSLRHNMEWKTKNKATETMKQIKDAEDSGTGNGKMTVSTKEAKVVRMLVLISIMFVICYCPTVLLLYIRFVVPELAMWKTYHNLFMCVYSFVFFLEISNSSINIVVYYVMSSKYRATFLSLFGRNKSLNVDNR